MADQNKEYKIIGKLDLTDIKKGLGQIRKDIEATNTSLSQGKGISPGLDAKQLQDVQKKLGDIPPLVAKTNAGVADTGDKVKNLNVGLAQTSNLFADVARRVFVWGSLSAAIFGALQSMKELYDFTLKLNFAFADLKKVLPQESDFAFLKDKIFQFSIEFGTDPLDTLLILRRFAQAGLDAKDSLKATETALLGINATGAETEEIFNAIIGANRIFGIEFEDSARVIDKVRKVEAAFAVESKDLIASIQAIGPAITVLNGDIDDLFATIAALGEAARVSGKEAANSLKRVFSRLSSAEGVEALQSLGVTVYETADTFRPLRDILGDLSKALETASQVERQNIAIVLAQVRQYSKFLALLQNYDRALEALEISQSSFGDAFKANNLVLNTYENRLKRADATVKQFAEGVISGNLGVADSFTNVKVALADFIGVIKNVDPKLINAVLLGGGAYVALKGLRFLLTSVKGEVGALIGKYTLWQLITTKVATGMDAQKKAISYTIPLMSKFAAGLGIATVAIFSFSAIYAAFTKEQARRNLVIEQSIQQFREFKESLAKIDFKGIDTNAVEAKFSSLAKLISDLKKESSDGSISVEKFADALAILFQGKNYENLTQVELDNLFETIEKIKEGILATALNPFFDEVNNSISKMYPSFNRITESITETNRQAAGLPDVMEQSVQSVGRLQDKTKAISFTPFEEALGALVGGITANNIGVINKTARILNDVVDQMIEYGKAVREAGRAEADLKNINIIDYYLKYAGALEKGKEAIIKLIDPEKIFAKALEGVNKVQRETIIQDRQIARQKEMAEIIQAVTDEVKKQGAEYIKNKNDLAAFVAGVDRANKELREASEKSEGLFAFDFNTVAFLAEFKKTNAALLTGLEAQLTSLSGIGSISSKISNVFKISEQQLTAVDSALKSLVKNIADGDAELATLQIEAEALQRALKLQEEAGFIVNPDAIKQQKESLNNIRVKILNLTKQQEIAKDQLSGQVERLISVREELTKVTEADKRRAEIIKAQTKLAETLLQAQIKLAKTQYSNDLVKSFKETEKFYDEITKAQLIEIDNLVKIGNLETEVGFSKKQQLLYDSEIEKINRQLTVRLEATSKAYENIEKGVSNVASVFENLLSDQESFLEALGSSGKFLDYIKKGISGIAKAVAQSDAQVIAEQISKSSSGLFVRAKEELRGIENEIADLVGSKTLGDSLSSSLISAGDIAGQKISGAIINSAQDVAQIVQAVPEIVMSNLSLLQAQTSGGGSISGVLLPPKSTEAPQVEVSNLNAAVSPLTALVENFRQQSEVNRLNLETSKALLSGDQEAYNSIIEKLTGIETNTGRTPGDVEPPATGDDLSSLQKFMKNDYAQALSRRLSIMMGQAIGASIARAGGRNTSGVAAGGDFGTLIGATLGSGSGPAGIFLGSLLGGTFGSIFGGLFGGKEEEEKQTEVLVQIEKNTAQLVDRLTSEIVNAPSTFTLPVGGGVGGGVSITNVIQTSGGQISQTDVNNLTRQLNDLYSRSPKTITRR